MKDEIRFRILQGWRKGSCWAPWCASWWSSWLKVLIDKQGDLTSILHITLKKGIWRADDCPSSAVRSGWVLARHSEELGVSWSSPTERASGDTFTHLSESHCISREWWWQTEHWIALMLRSGAIPSLDQIFWVSDFVASVGSMKGD